MSLAIITGITIAGTSYQQSRQLIEQAQERTRTALAQGLVVALSDQLVVNDYAGMESRLIQAMADQSLASAVVINTTGKVLVHLQRDQPSDEPRLLFEPRVIAPPRHGLRASRDTASITTRWTPIEAGETLGWLRLRTYPTSTDEVLNLLARQYLVLGVLAAALLSTILISTYGQLRRQAREREHTLQREKADLELRAVTDPLTGVYNRYGIEQKILAIVGQPERRRNAQLAICMIDLDDFKPVNDVYGHAIGDQLLQAVCRRLRSFLRDGDLLGRIGGDEFLVVFQGCPDSNMALKLGRRLTAALSTTFHIQDLEVRIGASAGIALDGATPDGRMEMLLERADRAMYLAKYDGKGHVVVAQDSGVIESAELVEQTGVERGSP